MKTRDRKKLDKAIDKARATAENPKSRIGSALGDFGSVLVRCGSVPYEDCEEVAAQTLTVLSLGYLRIGEEHLVVNVVRQGSGLKSLEPGLGGESWPGLADQAMRLAQEAADIRAPEPTSSTLAVLSEAVMSRAQEVRQEEAGADAREVDHISYSSVMFVPPGWDGPAHWACALSGLRSRDLGEYIRTFPNGNWLTSTTGFGG